MADLRELFPILEDSATGAGLAPISRVEGDAAASQRGLIGFSFKDASGNVVLPQLNANGKIRVIFDAGTPLKGRGLVAGSATDVEVCSVTLTAGEVYDNIVVHGSCFRDAAYKIVWQDDATDTVLGDFLVGPGQFSFEWQPLKIEITAGASGTQKLKVMAKNINSLSDLRGDITCNEID